MDRLYYGTDIWNLNFLRDEPVFSTQDGFLSQPEKHIQMSEESCACLFSSSGVGELTSGLSW